MSNNFSFGYSEAVINPNQWITLRGYEHRYKQGIGNSGILDDLYARALFLKAGETGLLLVTLDLCGIEMKTADLLREAISEKTRIPKEHIMLSAAHTHSGPLTCVPLSSGVNLNKKHQEILENEIGQYLEYIKECILTICTEAQSRMCEGKLSASTLRMNLGYNRRYPLTDEKGNPSVRMHFNLWKHSGEDINCKIDEDIPVLMIERINESNEDDYLEPYGQKRIVLFSVPYHPVVLGQGSRAVSADYPGAARACIEEAVGSGTKAMFLLGACGDINVLMACQENPKAVKIVGGAIGYGVAAALSNRRKIEMDRLDALEEEYLDKNGNRIIVQVFKIGDSAIAAVSAECFNELGIRVRQASKYTQTLIATNSNGYGEYLPSKAAFEEGGYEVDSACNKGYQDDILDRIIERIAFIMNEML